MTPPPCGARKTLRAYAFPRVFRPLRKLRPRFICHRQREAAIPSRREANWLPLRGSCPSDHTGTEGVPAGDSLDSGFPWRGSCRGASHASAVTDEVEILSPSCSRTIVVKVATSSVMRRTVTRCMTPSPQGEGFGRRRASVRPGSCAGERGQGCLRSHPRSDLRR